ncbi:MAG: hypothetical protein ABIQ39_16530 [Ilumatobacteraceae bacterium]
MPTLASRTVTALTALALGAACVACGGGRAGSTGPQGAARPPTVSAGADSVPATTADSIRVAPLTPRDPSRISSGERAAIEALGTSKAGVPHSGHSHGHGMDDSQLELPLFNGNAAVFADEWLAAQRSVVNFDTLDKIKSLGYVRASAPGAGIGTHWVLWTQIAKPFDAAHPAMVLFDEGKKPAVLVGYSYWLQSPTEPVGFAGNNDQWHQHTGLCVVNGWVDREESTGPEQCAGTYLAGGDLWMLHAWVVPGYSNRKGRFATYNPMLCPPITGTPDDMRCPT